MAKCKGLRQAFEGTLVAPTGDPHSVSGKARW
jgi:hypothetical protein